MNIVKLLVAGSLVLASICFGRTNTVYVNPSGVILQSDVQTCISGGTDSHGTSFTALVDGDTLVIPAGSCHVTTPSILANALITIQGAGQDGSGNWLTNIYDDIPYSATSKGIMLKLDYTGTATFASYATTPYFRVTGLNFNLGTRTGNSNKYLDGSVTITHTAPIYRIDHNQFYRLNNVSVAPAPERGVIDHNTFHIFTAFAIQYDMYYWGGGDIYADTSWSTSLSSSKGGEHNSFIEDNTFIVDNVPAVNGISNFAVFDASSGARFVFRYNTCQDTYIGNHGTGTGGRKRSPRWLEVYSNTFTMPFANTPWPNVYIGRGGSGIFFNNTASATSPGSYGSFVKLSGIDRQNWYTNSWGAADGSSGFDINGTRIASASNGASLPQSTINVLSTYIFPSSSIKLTVATSGGAQAVSCTGKTATTFTTCTGGTGTMSTGGDVTIDYTGNGLGGGPGGVIASGTHNGTNPPSSSGSDLVVDAANIQKVTSASHSFTNKDAGNVMHITGGTGWTVGYYGITNVISGAALLANNTGGYPAALGATGGQWEVLPLGKSLIDTTASWTTNQWVGYAILNLDAIQSNGHVGRVSNCTSSTATTVSYSSNYADSTTMGWNPGDRYQIKLFDFALDLCGAGLSDLLTDQSSAPTPVWLHQIREPSYIWQNTLQGSVSSGTALSQVVKDRDFFNDVGSAQTNPTTPFDGLHGGIGHGTIANRPTNCNPGYPNPDGTLAPGAGYYATDSGNGTLYVCTATNTWSTWWTPYQHPHPLASSSSLGFTSAQSASFVEGSVGSFSVTTSGSSGVPTITKTGSLPSAVTFTDNGDGTATIAGTPAAGTNTSSPYVITITAHDGVNPDAIQAFSLNVGTPTTRIMVVSGTLPFGNVIVGNSPILTFTIRNTGNTSFNVTNTSDGVNDGVYTFSPSDTYSILPDPGNTGAFDRTVVVSFAPAAAATYNRTISVTATSTTGSPGTINATGVGIAVSTPPTRGALPSISYQSSAMHP
jgi:hypothetical protein